MQIETRALRWIQSIFVKNLILCYCEPSGLNLNGQKLDFGWWSERSSSHRVSPNLSDGMNVGSRFLFVGQHALRLQRVEGRRAASLTVAWWCKEVQVVAEERGNLGEHKRRTCIMMNQDQSRKRTHKRSHNTTAPDRESVLSFYLFFSFQKQFKTQAAQHDVTGEHWCVVKHFCQSWWLAPAPALLLIPRLKSKIVLAGSEVCLNTIFFTSGIIVIPI